MEIEYLIKCQYLMKSRKVLLGLLVGLAVCFVGTATAQKANYQNNKLVEIGPDNIGGRVTSLVVFGGGVDTAVTLYAGAATGGLYTRSDEQDDIWKYLPCYVDGEELTLPVSCMVKVNESNILIGTGESYYAKGNKVSKFAARGRGIFLFNTVDTTFTRLSLTNPGNDLEADFASVNDIEVITLQGSTYVYVATPKGLFRWAVSGVDGLANAPVKVFDGNVSNVVLSKQYNRAFFAVGGRLYKISDVINSSDPVDITGSCSAFGGNANYITLALAPSDESYLYAMVSDANGLMEGLYQSRNTNSWVLLSTSTVTPFSSVATDATCGALTVSPTDPTKVYLGGATIWVGKGYVENSPFQWTVSSTNETYNSGDYMATVYSSSAFVHSGIHRIVPDVRWNEETMSMYEGYYIVTDGGVYFSGGNSTPMASFTNLNRGMNSVQINGLAVCPDGSVVSGANSNACPFIEARVEHDGGANEASWYDNSGSNLNHLANIIWKGNGGQVAASRFTQYAPYSRRTIFVSSGSGAIGRAYADYNDYTNTQTWTADEDFMTNLVAGGPEIGQISLWETDNNTVTNDSITFTIDTLGYVIRGGERINITSSDNDFMGSRFQIQRGDSMVVLDPVHASYPFYHVFDHDFKVGDAMKQTVHQPYLSRMLAVTVENDMPKNSNVSYCWFPTDFRKTYDNTNDTRFWSHIYGINGVSYPNMVVRYTAMSQDGDCAFVVVEDKEAGKSLIARVHGINSADYSADVHVTRDQLNYKVSTRVTVTDTIMASDSSAFFNRRISSISIDPRQGRDALIVTFDGYGNDAANVVYINNASSNNYSVSDISLPTSVPVYSAMIEYTTGEVYVGTEDGVFKSSGVNNPSWQTYGAFNGVPVTAMYQVTCNYPMISYVGHDGVSEEQYYFPKTKWAYAMYFGTYGRGIFMDSTYVVDHTNEILDQEVYEDIPSVVSTGANQVRLYPNPAVDQATLELTIAQAGQAVLKVYDLTGKVVYTENLGKVAEGMHTRNINCQNLQHGMYLVNVIVNGQRATSKLVVR